MSAEECIHASTQELVDAANAKMAQKLTQDSQMGETSQLLPPEERMKIIIVASEVCIKHCNTLEHAAATRCCNTLQGAAEHATTHCNTLQHAGRTATNHYCGVGGVYSALQHTATHGCNTLLQHTAATHCNALQHAATDCDTL